MILNGSPRKNWNTALMLREAQKGAESVGAETEYIDLFRRRHAAFVVLISENQSRMPVCTQIFRLNQKIQMCL